MVLSAEYCAEVAGKWEKINIFLAFFFVYTSTIFTVPHKLIPLAFLIHIL